MMKQQVVFCDFDGTITMNDNILAIIKHFDPPGWEPIVDDVLSTKMTIKEGVTAMFRLLPSTMKEEIISFGISNAIIRDGFAEFISFCRDHNILLYVTSGGIDFFVYPILANFQIETDHIYCNGSSFSEENVQILWPHPCDEHCERNCGMCKPTIMRKFPAEQFERIIIGDSVTDFEGAKLADRVFSRSLLTEKCVELGLPHTTFTTFHDIITALEKEN